MSAEVSDGFVDYRCQRRGEAVEPRYRYRIAGESQAAEAGSLAFFLAERYLLFSPSARGIRCGQVNHTPYPLAEVEVETWDVRPLVQAGFADPQRGPDHIIGSSGVGVTVYPLTV